MRLFYRNIKLLLWKSQDLQLYFVKNKIVVHKKLNDCMTLGQVRLVAI